LGQNRSQDKRTKFSQNVQNFSQDKRKILTDNHNNKYKINQTIKYYKVKTTPKQTNKWIRLIISSMPFKYNSIMLNII